MEGLRGHKISIGPENSGTRAIVTELLARNGIKSDVAEFLPFNAAESGEKLLNGQLNAAVMVASWDTPIVQRLVSDPQVELVNFARADAYIALYPYLTKLILPQGVGNIAENRPPTDINLLATQASLIIRKDLNPSIQYLLLDVATDIHSRPGIFQKSGQFPAAQAVDFPVSKQARQFYKSGPPFLQRYLPFRLAANTQSLLVLLIPLAGILYPLLRMAPALYGWTMRRRIFSLYGEVKLIELEMETNPDKNLAELLERLNKLDSRARHMRVSNMYAQFLYMLRQHISLVRDQLQRTN
jgi:hypothetical protein